jgi:hypothetical protein
MRIPNDVKVLWGSTSCLVTFHLSAEDFHPLSDEFRLTEAERNALLPSGQDKVFRNRRKILRNLVCNFRSNDCDKTKVGGIFRTKFVVGP